jgi:hypothetical protein
MKNMLLEKVEYQIEDTPRGVWRRFAYPTGEYFAEFRSHRMVLGMPLLHYTRGKCPETGKRIVARGFFAVGRIAMGVIAIGQASAGIIAIGQASIGLLFCLAQGALGLYAIGQLAIGIQFGAGQLATGMTAIGQIAAGKYVLAQIGLGKYLWTMDHMDTEAFHHFQALWEWVRSLVR